MTGDIRHTFVCGATRSGKSEAELARLVPLAKAGDLAIVLLDPHGTLARKFLLHLDLAGLTGRTIYDRLADTDRVPGYDWLTPSAHPDALQREAENDERVREFAEVLIRRRGSQGTAGTPLIEETLLAALRLYVRQRTPVPLPWLANAFEVRSEARSRLLANCAEPELVRKFHELASLSPTARRAETAPAERILRAVLHSPAFRVRSGDATFDVGQFLDGRGILILDGGSRGNLSRDAASVMMGAVILRVIRHARTGAANRIVLVIDEAVNGHLVGLHESQALAEAGKWGLEVHVLAQDPFGFPTAEIRSNVLQNCGRHEWFRQGSADAARLAAEDIATPQFDPLRVHHLETRTRVVDAGFDRVRTSGTNKSVDSLGRKVKGVSEHSVLWPRRKDVKETQERYTALLDQTLLVQKELMNLAPGYRFVRDETVTATPEYVRRLADPWSPNESPGGRIGRGRTGWLADAKFRMTLDRLRERPFYRDPSAAVDGPRPDVTPGAASRLGKGAAGSAFRTPA
jgi:hypothetical protein